MRKSSQSILPFKASDEKIDAYSIYPDFILEDEKIFLGFDTLLEFLNNFDILLFDGYVGVIWEDIINGFNNEFKKKRIEVDWVSVNDFRIDLNEIKSKIDPYLGGEDPLFGKLIDANLEDFFDVKSLHQFKTRNFIKKTILYGSGASIGGKVGKLIYFDVPKNEIQFRSRAGSICNLFSEKPTDPKKMYKQFFFIDWVLLNKEKQRILCDIDCFVDAQNYKEIVWMYGNDLRLALHLMSTNAFRARPWFEPGPWGGQWIKDKIKSLNPNVPNYAWSFELISPENGLLLRSSNLRLEISFDFILYAESMNVLGEAAERFGCNFPIRFDFLDTFEGGNLSVQCHPTTDYIQKNFLEPFTQDESYYILDCKKDAKVFLGFQDSINKDEFRNELENSERNNCSIDIEKYVQTHSASKHDLFLIPNGTIHCSGINNLVLEISSTPYIYTFKMYDWLRLDLEGKPRTLNINRAFENLNFNRKGSIVRDEHISKTVILNSGLDWKLNQLTTHKEQFYEVNRLEFNSTFELKCNDRCFVMSLVEGESVEIETNNRKFIVNYAETFIVPAAAKIVNFRNLNENTAKVVMAFVKSEKC